MFKNIVKVACKRAKTYKMFRYTENIIMFFLTKSETRTCRNCATCACFIVGNNFKDKAKK